MRIFEFGNGLGKDQILLCLTNGTQPTGSIFDNNKNEINKLVSNITLKLFDWNYIVYTQDKLGNSAKMHLQFLMNLKIYNGVLETVKVSFLARKPYHSCRTEPFRNGIVILTVI